AYASAWTPGSVVVCTVGVHSWRQLVAFLTLVASWISTTVICHCISMLLSSSPFSSVVCSTVKAPPTGVGDVLQRIQSDSLGSCARDLKSGYVGKMNPDSGKLDFVCMRPYSSPWVLELSVW